MFSKYSLSRKGVAQHCQPKYKLKWNTIKWKKCDYLMDTTMFMTPFLPIGGSLEMKLSAEMPIILINWKLLCSMGILVSIYYFPLNIFMYKWIWLTNKEMPAVMFKTNLENASTTWNSILNLILVKRMKMEKQRWL